MILNDKFYYLKYLKYKKKYKRLININKGGSFTVPIIKDTYDKHLSKYGDYIYTDKTFTKYYLSNYNFQSLEIDHLYNLTISINDLPNINVPLMIVQLITIDKSSTNVQQVITLQTSTKNFQAFFKDEQFFKLFNIGEIFIGWGNTHFKISLNTPQEFYTHEEINYKFLFKLLGSQSNDSRQMPLMVPPTDAFYETKYKKFK